MREQYSIYEIVRLAEEIRFMLFRLPLYYCELNPIESVGSQGKSLVEFRETLVEDLINDALSQWKLLKTSECYSDYIKKVEETSLDPDNVQDNVEPFAVQ